MMKFLTLVGLALVLLALSPPTVAYADECGPVEEVQFWVRDPLMQLFDPSLNGKLPPWERTTRVVMGEHWSPLDVAIVVYGGCPARYVAYGGKMYSGMSVSFPFLVDFLPSTEEDPFFDPARPTFVATTETQINPVVGTDPAIVVIFDDDGSEIASALLEFEIIDHVPQPFISINYLVDRNFLWAEQPYEFVVGDTIIFSVVEIRSSRYGPEHDYLANLNGSVDLHGLPYDLDLGYDYELVPRVVGTWEVSGLVFDDDGNEVPISTTIRVRRFACDAVSSSAWWLWGLPGLVVFLRRRG